MNLAGAKPFTFDTSFDEEEIQRARKQKQIEKDKAAAAIAQDEDAMVEQAPPPPSFSEDDLQAAKAQAWQEGYESATAELTAHREAQVSSHLENLSAQISGMFVHQDVANERLALETTEVAVELVKQLLPTYAAQHGVEEVKATVAACIDLLTPDSRLILTLSEANKDILETHLQTIAARSGYEGRMTIVGDADLGPAETMARWDGGGLDRIEQTVWDAVEKILDRAKANLPLEISPAHPSPAPTANVDATTPEPEPEPEPSQDPISETAAMESRQLPPEAPPQLNLEELAQGTEQITDAAKAAALDNFNDGDDAGTPTALP